MPDSAWVKVDPNGLEVDRITTVVAAGRAVCLVRTADGYGALDNHCPHQGGPLGDGQLADGYLICPWHAYEYDPVSGLPPPGFKDAATAYPVEERPDGVYVQLPVAVERESLMDQLVAVLCDWGLDTVFGMVGHSNLGLADALRKAEDAGRLTYVGIRHEGAAAFAASGYAKTAGRPAACLTIAGPGATNLLTGLWDAKVDRVPIVALTGQVKTQVVGPGTFQEVDLAAAFAPVAEWSQTVLRPENATELAALAMKHAIVNRDVAHLIFPDEVQELGRCRRAPTAAHDRSSRGKRHRAAASRTRARRGPPHKGRATRDHLRQRRPRLRRRDRRARRTSRRADHHHLQSERSCARRPPIGVRCPWTVRYPGCVDPHGSQRLPVGVGRLVLGPHRHRHLRSDHPGRLRPDDARQVPSGRRAVVG